ncbi:MAG: hypothetical protein FJZ47_11325 [Candidatus Tectomicrobia bacterium]|uniref:DUF7668 domain-containing protein n=1 Tax=Tectimicrobiota bacterium TaxID=2528274 RepID=A0A937W398_UNCTE|nr:hypothetical protein [Candidatus Tectomicrobia bacterium]
MTVDTKFIDPIRALLHTLAQGHFDELERDGRSGRLSACELQEALHAYGRTLIALPNEAFRLVEVYPVQGQHATWAMDVPLWTAEEGRSDLTLSLTVSDNQEGVHVAIDDLHTL